MYERRSTHDLEWRERKRERLQLVRGEPGPWCGPVGPGARRKEGHGHAAVPQGGGNNGRLLWAHRRGSRVHRALILLSPWMEMDPSKATACGGPLNTLVFITALQLHLSYLGLLFENFAT